jgi:hypothetical protein
MRLKENAAEYANQKRKAQGYGVSAGGVKPAKRVMGFFRHKGHKDVPLVKL